MPNGKIRRRRKLAYLGALAIALPFYILLIIYWSDKGVVVSDFAILYSSARAFYEGESIYAPVPLDRYQPVSQEYMVETGRDTYLPNLNPPFQTLLFLPLGLLDLHQAYLVWAFLSMVFVLLTAWLIWRSRPGNAMNNPFLPILLLLLFGPTLLVFTEGQVTFLIFLLLVSCWLAWRKNHDAVAGALLGLAFCLKPFVGLLVVFFLVQRRWKLVAWSLGVFVGCTSLALAVFGIDALNGYQSALSKIDWYSFEWNASLRGFFSRLLGEAGGTGLLNYPTVVNPLVYAGSALALGAFLWGVWPRHKEKRQKQEDLGFMLALVVMLLVSPLGWIYYFPFLFFPLWFIIGTRISQVSKWVLYVVWVVLAVMPLLGNSSDFYVFVLLQSGFYTYVLLFMSALILWHMKLT